MSPSRGGGSFNPRRTQLGQKTRSPPHQTSFTDRHLEAVCRWSALFLVHFLPTWLLIFCLATAFGSHSSPSSSDLQREHLVVHHYYRVLRQAGSSSHSRTGEIPWLGATQGIPHQPAAAVLRRSGRGRSSPIRRQHQLPYNVIMILPGQESNNDKFGLTIRKAQPVIDIAIEDIEKSQIVPVNWINITYHDSREWEDTLLAER